MGSAVTFVVPVFNSTQKQVEYTLRCIDSINRISYPHELIIIDDKSALFTDFSGRCDKFIVRKSNVGIAPNWNLGIREAQFDYICILNSDIVLHAGVTEGLIEAFRGLDIGFTFPTPIDSDDEKNRRWGNTFIDGQTYAPCIMSTKKTYELLKEGDQHYDENLVPCWFEDYDMWQRARKAGVLLRSTTKAFVTHLGGGHQTVNLHPNKEAIFKKNKEYYLQKHNLLK